MALFEWKVEEMEALTAPKSVMFGDPDVPTGPGRIGG